MTDHWPPDTPLVALSPRDAWRVSDAYEGTLVLGGTGGGKTTGSGAALACAFLREEFGGLVCCAKPEERELWQRYAERTGRSNDLRIVSPDHPYRFNFLAYEQQRRGPGAGQTENLVNLLSLVTELAEGTAGGRGDRDPYWERAARQMLRNAIDVLQLSGTPVTLDTLQELIASAPRTPDEMLQKAWQESSLLNTLYDRATAAAVTARQKHDAKTAGHYWGRFFPTLDERPRGSIVSTFTSTADLLNHGIAWELLGTDITVMPEMAYDGVIFVLDLPIQEYGEVGRVIQGVWKTMFQRAVLRRDVRAHPRPVFLWCDEAQNFVSSFDPLYQATARSARAATVYMTQNVPSIEARLGHNSHNAALSLMANFQTRIWHANGDHVSNTHAADTIGKRIRRLGNESISTNPQLTTSLTAGESEQLHYAVPPEAFPRLRKGGPAHDFHVDAIVFQTGRVWKQNGETYLSTTFKQQ